MRQFLTAVGLCIALCLGRGGLVAQESSPPEPPSQAQAVRLYNSAAALFNRRAYELAAEEWRRFLKAYPKHPRAPQAMTYLGICYISLDQPQKAVEVLDQVVRQHGKQKIAEQAWLHLGIARYMAAKGNAQALEQAAQTLEMFVKRYPTSSQLDRALFYQGECYITARQWDKAAAAYQTLLEKLPQSPLVSAALYNLGYAHQEQKHWAEAEAVFSRFLQSYKRHPLRAEVQLRRGEVRAAQGKHAAAQEDFAQAAEVPGFALADFAQLRVGDMLAARQKLLEAAEAYQRVPERFPRSPLVPAARLEAGKCYYLAGKFDQAIAVLGQVPADKQPQGAEAAHWLARCYLKQNRPQKALQVAQKALQAPGVPKQWQAELLMDRGDALYQQPERKKDSIAVYLQLVKEHPEHRLAPEAQYAAALAALETDQPGRAEQLARDFRRRWPQHSLGADVAFVLAESMLVGKKYQEAARAFEQLENAYPEHKERGLWLLRHGVACHLGGKHDQAVVLLNKALEHRLPAARQGEAWHWLGSAYVKQQKYDLARQALEKAKEIEPAWPGLDRTLLLLGFVLSQQKEHARAVATLEELLQRFPQSPLAAEASYRLGQYAAAAGRRAKALEAYGQVLALWPKSPWVPYALLRRGLLQLASGNNQAALQDLEALLEKFPQHKLAAEARLGRGLALFNLKRYPEAIQELKRFLATAPQGNARAQGRYFLALCHVEQKQWKEAISLLEQLLQEDKDYPQRHKALYELAWAYRSSGQEQKALAAFARLAKEFPQSPLVPEALFHLAEARYQEKKYAEAARLYQQALRRLEQSADAPEYDPQAAGELAEQALHKWAWALYEQKQYDKALEVLARQLKRFPSGKLAADARFLAEECAFAQEDYPQVLHWYRQLGSPSQESYRQLALLHAAQAANQLEKYDVTLKLLQEVETRWQKAQLLPELLFERAYALDYSGKKQEAVRLYRRVAEMTAREVAARSEFMLGEYYFGQKQHREAIRHYFRAAYGYSYPRWQANSLYEAARCFEVLRKVKQARECYEELIQKFPQSNKVAEARKRLEALRKIQP